MNKPILDSFFEVLRARLGPGTQEALAQKLSAHGVMAGDPANLHKWALESTRRSGLRDSAYARRAFLELVFLGAVSASGLPGSAWPFFSDVVRLLARHRSASAREVLHVTEWLAALRYRKQVLPRTHNLTASQAYGILDHLMLPGDCELLVQHVLDQPNLFGTNPWVRQILTRGRRPPKKPGVIRSPTSPSFRDLPPKSQEHAREQRREVAVRLLKKFEWSDLDPRGQYDLASYCALADKPGDPNAPLLKLVRNMRDPAVSQEVLQGVLSFYPRYERLRVLERMTAALDRGSYCFSSEFQSCVVKVVECFETFPQCQRHLHEWREGKGGILIRNSEKDIHS